MEPALQARIRSGARGPGTHPQAGRSDSRQDHRLQAARPGHRPGGLARRGARPHRAHQEGARGYAQEEEGDRGQRKGQRKNGRQARRQGGGAMTVRATGTRMTPGALRVPALLFAGAALAAACATPPKPRELESYELLRKSNNIVDASKKSPDLVAGAEKSADKSREEW